MQNPCPANNNERRTPTIICSKCGQAFDSLLDDRRCENCRLQIENAQAEFKRLSILELARNERQQDGEVEIDDNAQRSEGNDNGRYVAAWVWGTLAGTPFDKEKGEEDERLETTEPKK
jgi:hypothetical protein